MKIKKVKKFKDVKNKGIIIGIGSGTLVAGASLSIALPLVLNRNDNDNSLSKTSIEYGAIEKAGYFTQAAILAATLAGNDSSSAAPTFELNAENPKVYYSGGKVTLELESTNQFAAPAAAGNPNTFAKLADETESTATGTPQEKAPLTAVATIVIDTQVKDDTKTIYLESATVKFVGTAATKPVVTVKANIDPTSGAITYQNAEGEAVDKAVSDVIVDSTAKIKDAQAIIENQKVVDSITDAQVVDAIIVAGGKEKDQTSANIFSGTKTITIGDNTFEVVITNENPQPKEGTVTFDYSINFPASANKLTNPKTSTEVSVAGLQQAFTNVDVANSIKAAIDAIKLDSTKDVSAATDATFSEAVLNTIGSITAGSFPADLDGVTLTYTASATSIPTDETPKTTTLSVGISVDRDGADDKGKPAKATAAIDVTLMNEDVKIVKDLVNAFNGLSISGAKNAVTAVSTAAPLTEDILTAIGTLDVSYPSVPAGVTVTYTVPAIAQGETKAINITITKGSITKTAAFDIKIEEKYVDPDQAKVDAAKAAIDAMTLSGEQGHAIDALASETAVDRIDSLGIKGFTSSAAITNATVKFTIPNKIADGGTGQIIFHISSNGKTDTLTKNISILGAAHWEVLGSKVDSLPRGTYYQKAGSQPEDHKYTSSIDEAEGYVEGHNPAPVLIPKPSSGDKVTIDGTEITAQDGTKTWDKSLPVTGFWNKKGGSASEFTTTKTEANGYAPEVLEVKPTVKGIDVYLTGGATYDKEKWSWKATTIPAAGSDEVAEVKPSIAGTKITASKGGDHYDSTKWTWRKTKAAVLGKDHKAAVKPKIGSTPIAILTGGEEYQSDQWTWKVTTPPKKGVNGVTEVKPSIAGTKITASKGGDHYDSTKWTWRKTKAAVLGKDHKAAVQPKIGDTTIAALTGGEDYDDQAWTWTQTSAGTPGTDKVDERASTLGGVSLGTNLPNGSDEATKAAIIDFLVRDGKLTAADGAGDDAGKKIVVKLAGGTKDKATVDGKFDTDFATSFATAAAKAKVYDALVKEGNKYGAGTAAQPATNGAPATYTASYHNTATTYKVEVNYTGKTLGPAPTGEPKDYKGDYNAGSAEVVKTDGTPAEYVASYNQTEIAKYIAKPKNDGATEGTPPTGEPTHYVSTDYDAGTAEVTQTDGISGEYVAVYKGTTISEYVKTVQNHGATIGDAPTGEPKDYKGDYNAGSAEVVKTDGTPAEYVASYNQTEIAKYIAKPKNDGATEGPVPTGQPSDWIPADYNVGIAHADKNNGRAGVYQASYNSVVITGVTRTVENDGATIPAALTNQEPQAKDGFDKATDYNAGVAHKDEHVPAKAQVDISKMSAGDKITVDTTEYTVQVAVAYPGISSGPFYQDGANDANFVTDITKAKGYVKRVEPSPVSITRDGTVSPITIDGTVYTWVDPAKASKADATTSPHKIYS